MPGYQLDKPNQNSTASLINYIYVCIIHNVRNQFQGIRASVQFEAIALLVFHLEYIILLAYFNVLNQLCCVFIIVIKLKHFALYQARFNS